MARLTDNAGALLGGLETLPTPVLPPLNQIQRPTPVVVTAPAASPPPVCAAPSASQGRRSALQAK